MTHSLTKLSLALLFMGVSAFSQAETVVSTSAELKAAIENSEADGGEPDGGVITLNTGTYSDDFTLTGKSLTLRAAAGANVFLSSSIEIGEMLDHVLTIEDITFSGLFKITATSTLSDFYFIGGGLAACYNLFTSPTSGRCDSGPLITPKSITFVGTSFSGINFHLYADEVNLYGVEIGDHDIDFFSNITRFVGNKVAGSELSLRSIDNFIVGNSWETNDPDGALFFHTGGSNAEILNNRFVFTEETVNPRPIRAAGSDSNFEINNNIFDYTKITGATHLFRHNMSTNSRTAVNLKNNIILTAPGSSGIDLLERYGSASGNNNLCIGKVNEICTVENGSNGADNTHSTTAITWDDESLFKPAATETRLINAGHPSQKYYDNIDSTDINELRNDIGVYGGPFNIEQFDKQLEEDATEPYIYPILPEHGQLTPTGIKIKTLVINRSAN